MKRTRSLGNLSRHDSIDDDSLTTMGNSYWLWVLLSAALLFFWPTVIGVDVIGQSPGASVRFSLLSHLTLVLGHVAAGVVLRLIWMQKHKLLFSDLFFVVGAIEGLSFLAILTAGSAYPRTILVGTVVTSAICYLALFATARLLNFRMRVVGLPLLSIVTIGIVGIAITRSLSASAEEKPLYKENFLDSVYYPLKTIIFPHRIPAGRARGGALERVGEELLLVTGDGDFYNLQTDWESTSLTAKKLPINSPLDAEQFLAVAPAEARTEHFRTADLLVQKVPEGMRIFLTHHYWLPESECYVLRISMLESKSHDLASMEANAQWKRLYDTAPCVKFSDNVASFEGMTVGGRLQLLNENELLLTVGDFSVEPRRFPQDPTVPYGKVMRVRIDDGSAKIFTMGHRNAQGLVISSNGTIWSTEHGPRGGDELNLLIEGKNYGWPHVTYGTKYQSHEWPYDSQGGPPSELPVYAWVPSIGISSVIESNSSLFPAWKGDLLVASLKGHSIYRVHLENNRAVVVEPIATGGRIRDIVEDSKGHVVMWMDSGAIVALEPAPDELDGSVVFLTHCQGCHQPDNDGQHAIGPDLGGVFGRKIASAPGYQYSNALKEQSGVWNEEDLRSFLTNPQAYAPGTAMAYYGGVEVDAEELDNILDYLKSLK